MASLYHDGEYIGEAEITGSFEYSDGRRGLQHYRDAWIYERDGDEYLATPRHWQNVLPPIPVRPGSMDRFFARVRKRLGIE